MEKKLNKGSEGKLSRIKDKPRHHYIRWIIITFILIVLIFGVNIYIQGQKEKSFIKGGQNAIDIILSEVKSTGGVVIQQEDEVTVLAKYSKDINTSFEEGIDNAGTNETKDATQEVDTTAEDTVETVEDTNSTSNVTNTTN